MELDELLTKKDRMLAKVVPNGKILCCSCKDIKPISVFVSSAGDFRLCDDCMSHGAGTTNLIDIVERVRSNPEWQKKHR